MPNLINPKDVRIIYRNLKLFSANVQTKLEHSVNSYGKTIRRGARQRVSSRGIRKNEGGRRLDIKSRITMKRANFSRGKTAAKIISAAPHSHLVEFGTTPHVIKRRSKRFKIVDTNVARYTSGDVKHPGARKKPFMRPAYMEVRNKFLRDVERIVRNEAEGVSL